MKQDKRLVAEFTIVCGVIFGLVAAIVAIVIQANVIHFLLIGGLIGIALGLWFASAPTETKDKEKPALTKPESRQTRRSPSKPIKKQKSVATSASGKNNSLPEALSARHRKIPTKAKAKTEIPKLESRQTNHSATKPIKKQKSEARGASGKLKARPKAGTIRHKNTPSTPSNESKDTELDQIQNELNSLYARHDQLMQTMGNSTFRGGKLSKNADYHDTEEQLGFVKNRINNLEWALANSRNWSRLGDKNMVQIGSTVVFQEYGLNEVEELKIVSTNLSNGRHSSITANSPIGNALMGKRKGDSVRVRTPNGTIKLHIIDVR